MTRSVRQLARAFTIIELMLVMALLILVMAIVFPTAKTMLNFSAQTSAIQLATAAVQASRVYAMRDIKFTNNSWVQTGYVGSGPVQYSGAAALFTPANTVRIMTHTDAAYDSAGKPLGVVPTPDGGDPIRLAFVDLAKTDAIKLPKSVAVYGIRRGGSGSGQLELVAPPFALRFDQSGYLLAGTLCSNAGPGTGGMEFYLYTDSNYDGKVAVSNARPSSGYNPDAWNPDSDTIKASGFEFNDQVAQWTLPFDQIETVVGLLIFNREDFYNETSASSLPGSIIVTSGSSPTGAAQWLLENDQVQTIMFNRYTGVPIREGKMR